MTIAPAAPSPPLPQAVRARRLPLDGTWEVELEPGLAPLPIRVPFPFEAPLSGIGRGGEIHERLRYRRSFTVPDEWEGMHALLRFGAVDWRARVLVDGRDAGGHEGGYTHFALDLGPLDPGRAHDLVVEVEDPAQGSQPRGKQHDGGGIWYTRTTGIWRPVWLEAVPAAHVSSFRLDAHADGTVEATVATTEPTEVTVRVGDAVARAADGRARLVLERPRLWSPEDPFLYDAVVETASGDRIESYVGLRTIERRGSELLLNGEPRRFAGVLDQGFWPGGVYTAPDDDALRADVEAVKAYGFDLARMHVKVADPRWYAWCDRLGLLVVQDLPSSFDLSTPSRRAGFVRETEEIVEQLRGHPSVVSWVLFNEDWGRPPEAFQRELVRRVRALDPARLVVDASGWTHRGDTDVHDVHDYGDDLSRHASADGVPTWLGECGGLQLVADAETPSGELSYAVLRSPDELAREYARRVDGLGDVAAFVWTQLADVEGELNGLLTDDRVPKLPPEPIRAANERFRRKETACRPR